MDSELKLNELIHNENMNEIFILPSGILIFYIISVNLIFYEHINEYLLGIISSVIIWLIIEYCWSEIKNVRKELTH